MAALPQPGTPEHAFVLKCNSFAVNIAHSIANGVDSVTLPAQALVCVVHGLQEAKKLTESQKSAVLQYHARESDADAAALPDVTMVHELAAGKTLIREVSRIVR